MEFFNIDCEGLMANKWDKHYRLKKRAARANKRAAKLNAKVKKAWEECLNGTPTIFDKR